MYEAFLKAWLADPKQPQTGTSPSPKSLWVYGRQSNLETFSAELKQLFASRNRRLVITSTDRWAGDLAACLDRDAIPAARSKAVSLQKELEEVPVLAVWANPASIVEESLYWTDHVVNARYGSLKATLVLSNVDPVSAYHSKVLGQEDYSMPRIVGRILEDGDAIEVDDDGVSCAEFVFNSSAATDYRIKILRNRVGRVAVLRPRPSL